MPVSGLSIIAIVVPCYDEAERLDPDGLTELSKRAGARLVLVDDGSTDGTAAELRALADSDPERFTVLVQPTNLGKGESVRRGLLHALGEGATIVGYYDADLATPPAEMARLVGTVQERSDLSVVMGARVGLLGHAIERSLLRHYLGRVFATASSVVLGLDVYDTQCGAKVFRAGPVLEDALAEPFASRWVFDVELLSRLHRGRAGVPGLPASAFLEVPLNEWHDVDGTKLGLRSAAQAALDLARISREQHRRPS